MQDELRKEQSDKSSALLGGIFNAFRETRQQGSKEAFTALQDALSEHAGELVRLQLTSLKELIDMLMKLDGMKAEKDDEGDNELQLQNFLRKAEDTESVQ